MELRQLQYFKEVCRSGNFTKAAANLYVAQPSITNAIHNLEDELGVRLLNRNNKSVALTAEGRIFLERVEALLSTIEDITQEMKDLNNLSRGSLKLGVPPQIGAYLFPSLFTKFGNLYPNLDLNVTEEGSAATIALIAKGELDVGFVILPETLTGCDSHVILQEPIVLCVGSGHRLSGQPSVSFAELKDEKFILRKSGSFHRDIALSQCSKYGITPNIVFSSSQIQTIKTLVAKNIGITLFMEMTVRNEPNIKSIPLAEPLFVNIGLAWKKGKYLSKAAQAFIDFVISTSEGRPNLSMNQ